MYYSPEDKKMLFELALKLGEKILKTQKKNAEKLKQNKETIKLS